MNNLTEAAVTIFSAIIGVAILSVLVSQKANTAGVIQAAASGFSNSIGAAVSPVTGGFAAQANYPGTPLGGGLPHLATQY